VKQKFDPVQYKLNSKVNWNVVAPDYHKDWADKHIGPFKSTLEIVKIAEINSHDKVLDVACGTGVVSKEIMRHIEDGFLIGIDLSRTALTIAKKSIKKPNAEFLEMDAEHMTLNTIFDRVLCQYALMFFPDVQRVLKSIKKILKKGGRITIAVHGAAEDVPYFSCIMNPVLRFIPDIRPEGTPTVHRFGNPDDLKSVLSKSGFHKIVVKKYNFQYTVNSFDEYWNDYMRSTANSIRPKIESHGKNIILQIKNEVKKTASKYENMGKIVFPWAVLIATATK